MSPRLADRRRKRRILFAAVIFVLLLALGVSLVWVSNAAFVRVTNVLVSGEDSIPDASLTAVVQHELEGKYFGLFAKNNIFLYPKVHIERELLALYPTLKSAKVVAQNFHTIAVSVVERTPKALWCNSTGDETQGCILLDENGLAYANAPSYSAKVYRTYVGPLKEGPLPKQFLLPEQFRSLAALVDALEKNRAPDRIAQVSVDEHTDVQLVFSPGYAVLFALGDDSGQILDRFVLALGAAPFLSHKLSEFEYIDLRFGDKVYYKLKGQ
jgi:cell division septal protein FtsQ